MPFCVDCFVHQKASQLKAMQVDHCLAQFQWLCPVLRGLGLQDDPQIGHYALQSHGAVRCNH